MTGIMECDCCDRQVWHLHQPRPGQGPDACCACAGLSKDDCAEPCAVCGDPSSHRHRWMPCVNCRHPVRHVGYVGDGKFAHVHDVDCDDPKFVRGAVRRDTSECHCGVCRRCRGSDSMRHESRIWRDPDADWRGLKGLNR